MAEIKTEITFDTERFEAALLKRAAIVGFDNAVKEMAKRFSDYTQWGEILDAEVIEGPQQ